ncbi:hypothetical protein [Natronorubrum tibetense]|uniref:hypothetical protein n=1 Tax=Natronorubrum tibetense TaxID=63128 RepID=UPI0012B51AE6|nr:hypothetical protein [Natronorubrum tibetense]
MSTLTDRRFLVFCAISAFIGVPAAVWQFPNDGIMMLIVPIVILTILMFADGYATSA